LAKKDETSSVVWYNVLATKTPIQKGLVS